MLGESANAILHSLGVLALVSIGISMLQPGRLTAAPGWRRSVVMGLVFGVTVAVVMAAPMVFAPGVTIDPRGGPAMLAGVYGGPVAAIVAAAVGGAMRWSIGGVGAVGGITGLAIYAGLGTLAWHHLGRRGTRPTLPWFLGLAIVGTICACPTVLLLPDWRAGLRLLADAWWMVLIGNVAGVLVLGFLLEQDWRRRQLEQELRDTEARTRIAADAKTRFVASMSHEIRTPMNAVVGFVDLLRDSHLDGFQRRCTEQIRDAAQGLLRIIEDLLDYAKIEDGRVTLDTRPTDAVALIEGCRDMLLPQVEAKGIACTLDLPDAMPAVDVDPVRLRQVLLNLMGNAVKFTDSGRVAVSARHTPGPPDGAGQFSIVIADTGIGMTEEECKRLFSPFAQGDHVGRGGTGLGLVISRMLVQAMGGEIEMQSCAGVGTTVTVRLPVTEAAAVPARPAVEADSPAGGLRILVAEDVALNAEMLQVTLEQSGHSVRVVGDGLQAVQAVQAEPFDVILMDVQMPVMNGLEATRSIRALGGSAGATPIVALTAYASRDDLKTCLDSGMNDFLTKPLERPKLQQVLAQLARSMSPPAAPATGVSTPPAGSPDGSFAATPDEDAAGGDVERLSELLRRLEEVDRIDRDAVRMLADGLGAAAVSVGLDGLADRARRLAVAARRSNADALGALIEDVSDAGRRALDGVARSRPAEGR